MKYNLIGLSGKKRSGKDTVSIILQQELNENFEIKSFAYNLKHICSILTGLPVEYFLKDENKNNFLTDWDMSVRYMLQKVGTEVFRDNFTKDVWVKSLFSQFQRYNNWIISDVRFKDELQSIKERGGVIIRVDASYIGYEKPNDEHQSEIDLDNSYDDFDYVINNDSDMDTLRLKVKEIISEWQS